MPAAWLSCTESILTYMFPLCMCLHLTTGTYPRAVNLKECLSSADGIRPSDPDFRVLDDGSVYPARALVLSGKKRSFTIQLSDSKTQTQKEILVMLEHQKKVRKAQWTSMGLFLVTILPLKNSILYLPFCPPSYQSSLHHSILFLLYCPVLILLFFFSSSILLHCLLFLNFLNTS